MTQLFNEILLRPLLNLLIAIYNTIALNDFGLAVVIVTVAVRLVLSPFSIKAIRSQKELSRLQPKIKELQEKYKDNKEEIGRATMQLYREHKVNPFSGCLPLLIQIPVLLALYQAFYSIFEPNVFDGLYSFVSNPVTINPLSFGFVTLANPSWILAIVAGGLQFIQSRLSAQFQAAPGNSEMGAMNKQLLYFFPLIVIIISWKLPTGIVLYWIATTLYSIVEQFYISRRYHVTEPTKNP